MFYINTTIFIITIINIIIILQMKQPIYYMHKIDGEVLKKYSVNNSSFLVNFNKTLRQPNYTFNKISRGKRCANSRFVIDRELNTYSVQSMPYAGDKKFDRGHLTPAGDLNYNCHTFVMSNISPQLPCFNQGIWRLLEEHIRSSYQDYYVITVPEYEFTAQFNTTTPQGEQIWIPRGFYKIVVRDDKIFYKIYLEHFTTCGHDFRSVGNFNRLPYFIEAK